MVASAMQGTDQHINWPIDPPLKRHWLPPWATATHISGDTKSAAKIEETLITTIKLVQKTQGHTC